MNPCFVRENPAYINFTIRERVRFRNQNKIECVDRQITTYYLQRKREMNKLCTDWKVNMLEMIHNERKMTWYFI